MRSIVKSFQLQFLDSEDWIEVKVFRTIKCMRNALKKVSDKNFIFAVACCHSPHKRRKNKMIARIFLNLEHLGIDSISHECTHAARTRQRLRHRKINEEQLATDIGNMTDTIVAILLKQRFGKKVTVAKAGQWMKIRK